MRLHPSFVSSSLLHHRSPSSFTSLRDWGLWLSPHSFLSSSPIPRSRCCLTAVAFYPRRSTNRKSISLFPPNISQVLDFEVHIVSNCFCPSGCCSFRFSS